MKKILTILILVAVSLSLSACGKKDETEPQNQAQESFSQLSDWLSAGKDVKCTVDSLDGEIALQIKAEKVRMDGIAYYSPDNSGTGEGHSITDGEWIYIWGGQSGMKFNLNELEKMQSDMDFNPEDYSWENWSKKQEEAQVQYECSFEDIAEAAFNIPTNVEFVNFSEMIGQFQEIGTQIKDMPAVQDMRLPEIDGAGSMTQEEIEAKLNEMLGGFEMLD